jgi:periplasmic copper chaperone A
MMRGPKRHTPTRQDHATKEPAMMRRKLFAAALFALPLAPGAARADDAMVTVEQPWARATPGAAKSGAVYLTLTDHGAPDRLIGVSTPAADMAMLHESFVENGVSKMRMLDGVALDASKPVALHPGALHIMLEGLKAPLKVGSSFPLTLTFEHAPPQTVTVTVLKAGAPGPAPAAASGTQDMKDMPGMKKGQ